MPRIFHGIANHSYSLTTGVQILAHIIIKPPQLPSTNATSFLVSSPPWQPLSGITTICEFFSIFFRIASAPRLKTVSRWINGPVGGQTPNGMSIGFMPKNFHGIANHPYSLTTGVQILAHIIVKPPHQPSTNSTSFLSSAPPWQLLSGIRTICGLCFLFFENSQRLVPVPGGTKLA